MVFQRVFQREVSAIVEHCPFQAPQKGLLIMVVVYIPGLPVSSTVLLRQNSDAVCSFRLMTSHWALRPGSGLAVRILLTFAHTGSVCVCVCVCALCDRVWCSWFPARSVCVLHSSCLAVLNVCVCVCVRARILICRSMPDSIPRWNPPFVTVPWFGETGVLGPGTDLSFALLYSEPALSGWPTDAVTFTSALVL